MRLSRREFSRLLGAGLVAAGCGGTGGRSVTFRMALQAVAAPGESAPGRFTTDTGWRVELSVARVLLGPIYLFENAPPVQAQGSLWRRVGEWLLPTAHAHEEFFAGGRALGEWDREVVVDALALAEPRVLGRVPGIAGRVRSMSMLLQAARVVTGQEAALLSGHTALLEGRAEREGQSIAFRAGLDFAPPIELQKVNFVPLEVELDEGGLFVTELRLHRWFDGARFERLSLPAGTEQVELGPETQVHRALSVNVRQHTSYGGRWEPLR